MGYALLFGAIGAEVFATTMLRASEGFSKILPSVLCVIGYIVCYVFFGHALKYLNLAIAYALWCGIGIVATSFFSYFLFHERISLVGYAGIGLIMAGCILVNLKGTP